MANEPRQCTLCGRKGTRQFVPVGGAVTLYMCKRPYSCNVRRQRLLAPVLSHAK